MDRRGFVLSLRFADLSMLTSTALAEHYAISKTPLARGLKVINTERASVTMRYDYFCKSHAGRRR